MLMRVGWGWGRGMWWRLWEIMTANSKVQQRWWACTLFMSFPPSFVLLFTPLFALSCPHSRPHAPPFRPQPHPCLLPFPPHTDSHLTLPIPPFQPCTANSCHHFRQCCCCTYAHLPYRWPPCSYVSALCSLSLLFVVLHQYPWLNLCETRCEFNKLL